ncbi:MAG TPA: NADH-quinone oxidoreductase subunit NuoG [Steroidobacteraceae bacterium]|nr:NADH-quinone oxidoreductase subunit NuoG [Steroidobacteraceae bacterium]
MATIYIDGRQYEVGAEDNLLHACLSHGLDIPYFCWHPALGSVGACRQCAVKQYRDANDQVGHLVMSCMTPSADGTRISIADEEAKQFRASVIEWLMTNHPHDCPVCEEGGHCHLQDMTVMTGHASRRYRFSKRTHKNQYLGPFVNHEMNRCIACYRCVRYYKDYAGGTDLDVYGVAHNVYFGRLADGVLENEFSGNLVEVCPTGVFTDKTHGERYNRKWDMQFSPSICQGCSVGCNISPGERYGELRRIENRYNGSVNHHFLCDRGRFGYGYVNRKDRPRQPLARRDGSLAAVEPGDALARAAQLLKAARGVVGIGSPRASLESNFALRALVGLEHFYDGHAGGEGALVRRVLEILKASPLPAATLRGIEDADAVLVLGEDVTNTAPRVALAVRQSARGKTAALAAARHVLDWQAAARADIGQHERHPVFIASMSATRLDDIAADTLRAAPDDIARLGFAVAHALDAAAPAVERLDSPTTQWAETIARALSAARKPLIISGTGSGSAAVLQAAGNVALALHARGQRAELCLIVPEVNSLGLALLNAGQERCDLDAAFAAVERGEADTLVVLENDLYRRADRARIDALLAKVKLIVLDHQSHATAARAEIVLPAGSFAESDGTLVSQEGRAQRYFKVYEPGYYDPHSRIRESWEWLDDLRLPDGQSTEWRHFDRLCAAVAEAVPGLREIVQAAPNAHFRMRGLKVAREPHRYSGRTAMRAHLSVHEPRQPQDGDSALAFSMEGHNGTQAGSRPSALIPYAWAPGWNSPQSWNKFQDEVGGHLQGGDPGVRLIEPAGQGAAARYEDRIPGPFTARAGEWQALPLAHIFGSEELSARAAPLASLIPAAYVALHPADADVLGADENSTLEVSVPGETLLLPLRRRSDLPRGTVGLAVGVPGSPWFAAGALVKLGRGSGT